MQKVIFTDLDGTLLDHDTYSYEKAKEGIALAEAKGIPLVICTSKTKKEIEFYRRKLGNSNPFISENGGAIFIPKDYFDFTFDYDKEDENYFIIQLGTDYGKLVEVIESIGKQHELKTFHGMTVEEVAEDTGLPMDQAELAKEREFDEAFRIINPSDEEAIIDEIRKNKLNYTIGGRYYHIMGNSDKGRAVKILSQLFMKKYGKVATLGFGDSQNDFEMLDAVDEPYIVKGKDNKYASQKYNMAGAIGPEGVNEVLLKEIPDD